jgi:hopanoid biosynthesis associated RND transporter like protein HpnN
MKRQIDDFLARLLSRWVDGVRRRASAVSAGLLITTLVLAVYTVLNLGINSDFMSMVADRLPSRALYEEFIQHFPNNDEALFLVVDGETPELAREAATAIANRLKQETEYFTDVYLPGGGEFFEQNGLLYRSPEELDYFADQMARIQPLVAELETDSSISNMTRVVRMGLDDIGSEEDARKQLGMVLDRVSKATVASFDPYPMAISWEEVLLEGSSVEVSTRRVVVTHPIMDYGHVLVAQRPLSKVDEVVAELGYTPDRGVTVRATGNPALSQDEMVGMFWDVSGAGVFCFALVTFILFRAYRSYRLVIAALIPLFAGLIWTGAFAAVSIGSLNLLSISFAILYLGLGVDSYIHFGMGYAHFLREGRDHADALRQAASHVGGSLVFCAITTSVGFFVFTPTQYRGMAELGLIAGCSMFIILFLTVTLFPALLSSWIKIDPDVHLQKSLYFKRGGWWNRIEGHPRAIRWAALGLLIPALFLLPGVRFDPNVVEMRDPTTPSVQAFHDLMENATTMPWYVDIVKDDLETAERTAVQVRELDTVRLALTLQSYVPDEQEEKLEILGDLSMIFETPPGIGKEDRPPQSIEEQVQALRELRDYLGSDELDLFVAGSPGPLAGSVARLRDHLSDFVERVESEGNEAALANLEAILMAPLPAQLARLRRAMLAERITLESLPEGLVKRMQTEEGLARIQIFPDVDLRSLDEFRAFVYELKAFDETTTGVPVNIVEFGRAVEDAFFVAVSTAVLIISGMLYFLWRRLSDVVFVLAPLFLGTILTVATVVATGNTFNFTNVIVVPLIFGLGVDSGIHMVHESRKGAGERLVNTFTARAVYYSAITTIVSFGSLSLASHNGLRTLGITLTAGLVYTVMCVLFLLPALMDLREKSGSGGTTSASDEATAPAS